jgi:hypothetical protein
MIFVASLTDKNLRKSFKSAGKKSPADFADYRRYEMDKKSY